MPGSLELFGIYLCLTGALPKLVLVPNQELALMEFLNHSVSHEPLDSARNAISKFSDDCLPQGEDAMNGTIMPIELLFHLFLVLRQLGRHVQKTEDIERSSDIATEKQMSWSIVPDSSVRRVIVRRYSYVQRVGTCIQRLLYGVNHLFRLPITRRHPRSAAKMSDSELSTKRRELFRTKLTAVI